ncbi:MAG: signal peptidase I [Spirochaetes bacterium]|nr:signal peptidase I [Spirochaetota bacterium]
MNFGKKYEFTLFEAGKKKKSAAILKLVKIFVIALIVYELITGLFLFTVTIGNNSMAPLMQGGNRLLIFKPAYSQGMFGNRLTVPGITQPGRGDVVVFRKNFERGFPWYLRPVNSVIGFVTFQRIELGTRRGYTARVNVSRIVGIPGDTIKIIDNVAYIKPRNSDEFITEFVLTDNRYTINIPSFPDGWDSAGNPFFLGSDLGSNEIVIAEGYYFIMGDNRELYLDSRTSGLIPAQNIKGRVIFRYWPFNKINVF